MVQGEGHFDDFGSNTILFSLKFYHFYSCDIHFCQQLGGVAK